MNSTLSSFRSVGAVGVLALLALALSGPIHPSRAADSLTEQDYLADMPVVLSVSRLAQRLDETPGAVTVIDRDTIRLSGARDVADLLRLVPGFQTSTSFESVAPLASYHGKFDDYSNRLELMIDGRSVYSTYFIGSIGPGLQTVALEDIERIEVLRGSNSAAYGARAFLGVINIVTRHSADTLGSQGAVTVGENGVRDAQARIGWGSTASTYRLTVDRRGDDGLIGANGANLVQRVNFRADSWLDAVSELQWRAGYVSINANKGRTPGKKDWQDNPARPFEFASGYLQVDYRLTMGSDNDLTLRYAHGQETYRDEYPYALQNLNPTLGTSYGPQDIYMVRASGTARSDVLTLQHSVRVNPATRLAWGGEYRNEQVQSSPLFNTDTPLITEFVRLFGNLEWRPARDWLINAGALAEHSSHLGNTLSPRVMTNWRMLPGHTLRVGVSKAFRPPSTFEESANVRYLVPNLPPNLFVQYLSSGAVQSETVVAKELGYLGEFKAWRATLDVRLFNEQIKGFIRRTQNRPFDFYNSEDFSIKGIEYQLKWQPWASGQVAFSQTRTDIGSKLPLTGTAYAAPKLASTLMLTQRLSGRVDVSLIHQEQGEMTLQGSQAKGRFPMTRTDLRVAKALRWGSAQGELALVIQNLGDPYRDFDPAFSFGRRAFVTLRLQE